MPLLRIDATVPRPEEFTSSVSTHVDLIGRDAHLLRTDYWPLSGNESFSLNDREWPISAGDAKLI
jgi:hypothetical protein